MEYSYVLIFQLILLASCKQHNNESSIRSFKAALGNALNEFAVNSFIETPNLVISPFSEHAVLTTVHVARSNTEDVNNYIARGAAIRSYFGEILKNISNIGNDYQLSSANRIYVKKGFKIPKKFIGLLGSFYDGQFMEIEFLPSERAAKSINEWVQNVTNLKTETIVGKDMFDKYTGWVFINAIYFKGKWRYEFNKNYTKNETFYESENKQRSVAMMQQQEELKLPYYEDEEVQIVGLPYNNPDLKMIIFMPVNKSGLNDFEKSLNNKRFQTYIDHLVEQEVIVKLPNFGMSLQTTIPKRLMELGIGNASNSDAADFSAIKNMTVVEINKAAIVVNEEGTEAAAATIIEGAKPTSERRGAVFIADHPFVYAVLYKRNILFIGRFF